MKYQAVMMSRVYLREDALHPASHSAYFALRPTLGVGKHF